MQGEKPVMIFCDLCGIGMNLVKGDKVYQCKNCEKQLCMACRTKDGLCSECGSAVEAEARSKSKSDSIAAQNLLATIAADTGGGVYCSELIRTHLKYLGELRGGIIGLANCSRFDGSKIEEFKEPTCLLVGRTHVLVVYSQGDMFDRYAAWQIFDIHEVLNVSFDPGESQKGLLSKKLKWKRAPHLSIDVQGKGYGIAFGGTDPNTVDVNEISRRVVHVKKLLA